jgi:prepilin-type N-terminal cleavage/methylation domain-containing protein
MKQQTRPGFTLLEVVLAIALSATLLALIASALSLFLSRTDDGRQRVEQAQLARNLLRLVGDDLRNVALYSPQDTSIAAQLAQAAGSFDVDAISGGGSGSGTGGGTGTGTGGGTGSGSGGGSSNSSPSGGGQSSSGSPSTTYQQPLGVYGNLNELQIDVLQPARPVAAPADQSAMSSDEVQAPLWRGGVRTVRYYCREGQRPRSDVVVSERLGTTERSNFGGLVREEIDRSQFDFAQQVGTAGDFTQSGQVLAPEVLDVEFRYSDGTQVLDEWNSEQLGTLPVAIEVRMWLQNADAEVASVDASDLADATQYVMTVPVWRSALASGGTSRATMGSGSNTGSSSSGSGTSGSGSTGSGDGSGSSSNF